MVRVFRVDVSASIVIALPSNENRSSVDIRKSSAVFVSLNNGGLSATVANWVVSSSVRPILSFFVGAAIADCGYGMAIGVALIRDGIWLPFDFGLFDDDGTTGKCLSCGVWNLPLVIDETGRLSADEFSVTCADTFELSNLPSAEVRCIFPVDSRPGLSGL